MLRGGRSRYEESFKLRAMRMSSSFCRFGFCGRNTDCFRTQGQGGQEGAWCWAVHLGLTLH